MKKHYRCDFQPVGERRCRKVAEEAALDDKGELIAVVCKHHAEVLSGDYGADEWKWFDVARFPHLLSTLTEKAL